MKCIIVSHTHWDREWYRTFETLRARLVDTVDRVLALIECDPGFHFLLDGQTIVLEDYLAIRPERREALRQACRDGRLAIGPWYVQPDSLLPSGEAHVRNLLEGRRSGSTIGGVSAIAYTPDSFGHPAQFPQLFRGFGLDLFVYWRGNGNEIDALPSEYLWEAPDGSRILAHHLSEGYFAACGLPGNADAAALFLKQVGETLATRTGNAAVVLMNGIDHALPDAHVGAVAEALARLTGWDVRRGLLEDFAAQLTHAAPRYRGELTGARVANLLPGVWSARIPLKLRNRRCEMLLEGWAEPWAGLARCYGVADERPALRLAWRALLQNQAHDSIGGCSQDRVHEQMQSRYDRAEELARETTRRVLEQLAGLGVERTTPATESFDVAVFNPSAHARTDVVRLSLEPAVWFAFGGESAREMSLHPWMRLDAAHAGFSIDGQRVRVIADSTPGRLQLLPDAPPLSLEWVAGNVPAFGWRRFTLTPSPPAGDHEDDGRTIACGDVWVRAADDGTLELRSSAGSYRNLCGIEDVGDRGDSYDFDPVPGAIRLDTVSVQRRRHPSGIQSLIVRRTFSVPAQLASDRSQRSEDVVPVEVEIDASIAPGVERLAIRVRIDNRAHDHRLRLCFPTGRVAEHCLAATTLDVMRRETAVREDANWVHPAPQTFVQQGFVHANGLTVVAPGLPEAEVTADGVIAITLLRAVGWLARMDLTTRPQPAGPVVETPGAQCAGRMQADLSVFVGHDPSQARDAELGLRAVVAGAVPLLAAHHPLLQIEPREILLSALKPAEDGHGMILRLLNPTDHPVEAQVYFGVPFSHVELVRLDEARISDAVADHDFAVSETTITVGVSAHQMVTLRVVGRSQSPSP